MLLVLLIVAQSYVYDCALSRHGGDNCTDVCHSTSSVCVYAYTRIHRRRYPTSCNGTHAEQCVCVGLAPPPYCNHLLRDDD